MKGFVSFVVLALLLTTTLTVALKIQPVSATGTIYIRADGSIDPADAPISTVDNVTYIFTGDISDSIVVERNNIVVGGSGSTVQGMLANDSRGIDLTGRSNVTIKNVEIKAFDYGIWLDYSSNNNLIGNHITSNGYGIWLSGSSNTVFGNNITANDWGGVYLYYSSNNTIVGNNITANNQSGISSFSSNYNSIVGNNITANDYMGIDMGESSDNSISGNNIANNSNAGIVLSYCANNSIIENKIANNSNEGISLGSCANNSIVGNNIANNDYGVYLCLNSSDNKFYHNNVIDNFHLQVYLVENSERNVWDDGYPSGGNYWSDHSGTDLYRGLFQNETGKDWIGDTPHVIASDVQDRYPLMRPWPQLHNDLVTSCMVPVYLQLGSSLSLNATVTNEGLDDEVDVELMFVVNGTTVDAITIPLLRAGNSYTLSYSWAPTNEGTYNITAYARPVPEETSIENNQIAKFISVAISALPGVEAAVKTGDWMKIDYTIIGAPSGTPLPQWLKVEFLNIEGTNTTVRVTMHMSDGIEANATLPVDLVTGGQAFGLSGFVIPANLTVGDSIYMSGYGNVTIAGETIGSYAGARRTVVYASFSQYGTQLTYCWDKQTGVIVEASTTSGTMTATGKATETNLWQAQSTGLPIDPPILYALIVAVVVIVAAAVFLVIRRKKKPMEVTALETETRE